MDGQIIASVVAVVGSLGGTLIGALIQREGKKLAALERRIERYRLEIQARQAEEDIAAAWLVELGAANSERAAKLALRQRTEIARGIRPSIGPGEMRVGMIDPKVPNV